MLPHATQPRLTCRPTLTAHSRRNQTNRPIQPDQKTNPQELRVLQLHEVAGLRPRDVALLPFLVSLKWLTMVAPRDDAWLGLAPLRLLTKLPGLRHLDWVPSERAAPGRLRPEDARAILLFEHLHVLTLPAALGGCGRLQAVGNRMAGGCQLRVMAPVYCEHAARGARASPMRRLLSVASDLFERATGGGAGAAPAHAHAAGAAGAAGAAAAVAVAVAVA